MKQALRRILFAILLLSLPGQALAQLVADAGDDIAVECAGSDGTELNLDGTGSTQGAVVSYLWTTNREVVFDDATVLTPVGVFPPGETEVTLEVTSEGSSASDTMLVTVEDGTPPVVRVRADPFVLWPPNHTMHAVEFTLRVRDRCSTRDGDGIDVELLRVTSNEPDNGVGDGNTVDDIQDAQLGTDDRVISLRAERAGPGNGRVYEATYRVSDSAGNETDAVARVFVPHDEAQLKALLGEHGDDEIDALEDICPTPLEAVEEWSVALPGSGNLSSRRLCGRACRAWAQGCKALVKGAAVCERAETAAIAGLEEVICRDADAANQCRRDLRADARDLKDEMKGGRSRALEQCQSRGASCAERCRADLME